MPILIGYGLTASVSRRGGGVEVFNLGGSTSCRAGMSPCSPWSRSSTDAPGSAFEPGCVKTKTQSGRVAENCS